MTTVTARLRTLAFFGLPGRAVMRFSGPDCDKRFNLLRLGNSRSLPHPFRICIHVPGPRRVNETLFQGPVTGILVGRTQRVYVSILRLSHPLQGRSARTGENSAADEDVHGDLVGQLQTIAKTVDLHVNV